MEKVKQQYERHPFPPEDRRGMYTPHGEYLKRHVFNGGDGARVLEAGCGTGVMVTDIASVVPDADYVCMDFSEASIEVARRYQEEENSRRVYLRKMEFIQSDLFDIPDIGVFDLVESWGVIHHTEDPERAFRGLASRMKPGGFIRVGVYGYYGNEDRRRQKKYIEALVKDLSIEDQIRITREFMDTPDYKSDLCVPPLYHPNRCPFGANPVTDPEIVDEFLHVHEIHIRLAELVRWYGEEGIDVIDFTDWNNNQISMDIKFHTTSPLVIKRFGEMGEPGKKLNPQQAELIDSHKPQYWIALLGKKSS